VVSVDAVMFLCWRGLFSQCKLYKGLLSLTEAYCLAGATVALAKIKSSNCSSLLPFFLPAYLDCFLLQHVRTC